MVYCLQINKIKENQEKINGDITRLVMWKNNAKIPNLFICVFTIGAKGREDCCTVSYFASIISRELVK